MLSEVSSVPCVAFSQPVRGNAVQRPGELTAAARSSAGNGAVQPACPSHMVWKEGGLVWPGLVGALTILLTSFLAIGV